jgi:hypothetical protein
MEILGAVDINVGGEDYFKSFGRGWGMAHDAADPYVSQVSTAVPFLKTFTDAGDTIYSTYRGATGDKTTKQLKAEKAAKDKAVADKAAADKATAEGKSPTVQPGVTPQPGAGATAKKKPVWPYVAAGVGVVGVGSAILWAVLRKKAA